MPICPLGHKLRSAILGNFTELPLSLAFLRGFGGCGLALGLGILEDFRSIRMGLPHLGLMVMTGGGLVFGMIAFIYAWRWAGANGPVHRLTSRACGIALGSAAPAVVASHALYFHWLNPAEAACGEGVARLFELVLRS